MEHSDEFVVLRYEIWNNFIAASAPIRPEQLAVDDLVALIKDIGKDYIYKNKRGYTEIPKQEGK